MNTNEFDFYKSSKFQNLSFIKIWKFTRYTFNFPQETTVDNLVWQKSSFKNRIKFPWFINKWSLRTILGSRSEHRIQSAKIFIYHTAVSCFFTIIYLHDQEYVLCAKFGVLISHNLALGPSAIFLKEQHLCCCCCLCCWVC